jgi:hypothetical protein
MSMDSMVSISHFCRTLSSSLPPLLRIFDTIRRPQTTTMSFETTATIANFGGKLLKLAHQVSTQNMHNDTQLVLTPPSPKQPQPK